MMTESLRLCVSFVEVRLAVIGAEVGSPIPVFISSLIGAQPHPLVCALSVTGNSGRIEWFSMVY